jgi:EthD domain
MIKFILAARRKREDTQERYFYEWGVIHVALMLTTPSVMQTFRRYAQHYSIAGVDSGRLLHPLSDMEWDNMADHWLEDTPENFDTILHSDAYVQRMQPHRFGDHNFKIEFTDHTVLYEREGFQPGGVKLVHFLRRREGVPDEEFTRLWRAHADVVRAAAGPGLRRYAQGRSVPVTGVSFEGTLFAKGNVGEYAGVEELWFDGLDDVYRLREDAAAHAAISQSEAAFVDAAGSFSMVTMERVIYDFADTANPSPLPAVLQAGSLEALVDAQGYSGWNVP